MTIPTPIPNPTVALPCMPLAPDEGGGGVVEDGGFAPGVLGGGGDDGGVFPGEEGGGDEEAGGVGVDGEPTILTWIFMLPLLQWNGFPQIK